MLYRDAPPILQRACDQPDLLVSCGSRLYGTERRDADGNIESDNDLRGFVFPPWEMLIEAPARPAKTVKVIDGVNYSVPDPNRELSSIEFDQVEYDGDHIVYSAHFFFQTLLSCNPQLIECLFAPESHLLKVSEIGKQVLASRDAFVSKKFYRRILGFGNSEWRKARGVKAEVEGKTKTEEQVAADVRNVFGPRFGINRKEVMDQVMELLFSGHQVREVSSVSGISKKRRNEFEQFGYCSSSAAHAVRLVRQCTELMKTAKLTFPRPDAPELLQIKLGRMPLESVVRVYEDATRECEESFNACTLPEWPDAEKIGRLYESIVAKQIDVNRLAMDVSELAFKSEQLATAVSRCGWGASGKVEGFEFHGTPADYAALREKYENVKDKYIFAMKRLQLEKGWEKVSH